MGTEGPYWLQASKQYLPCEDSSEGLTYEKQGIKTSIEVIGHKSVAQGIIDYAKESGADVIVIGTKGLTGVGKFVMGGVASSVINNAHCPVVAIR